MGESQVEKIQVRKEGSKSQQPNRQANRDQINTSARLLRPNPERALSCSVVLHTAQWAYEGKFYNPKTFSELGGNPMPSKERRKERPQASKNAEKRLIRGYKKCV